jgi:8-oxo-dGTP pyrophosphatase MutT (NUDIX family)
LAGWEDDEDVYQAASREAMEEAGVKGVINVRASFTFVPGSELHCSESQLIQFNS